MQWSNFSSNSRNCIQFDTEDPQLSRDILFKELLGYVVQNHNRVPSLPSKKAVELTMTKENKKSETLFPPEGEKIEPYTEDNLHLFNSKPLKPESKCLKL
jgi:hypothetical protein